MAKVLSSLLRVWQIHSHNRSEQLLKLEEQMSYGIDFKKCGQFFLQVFSIVLFTDFHATSTKEKDQICRSFQQLFLPISMQHPVKKTNFFVRIFSIILFTNFHAESTFTVLHNSLLIYTILYSRHLRHHCSRYTIGIILYVQYILQYRKCTIAQVYNERYRTTY